MTISVKCAGCGKVYRFSDDKAEKRFKCKECGHANLVRQAKKKRTTTEDDWSELEAGEAVYKGPQRKSRTGSRSSSGKDKKRKRHQKSSTGSKLPLLIGGGVVALGVIIGGVLLFSSDVLQLSDVETTADSADTIATESNSVSGGNVPDESWRRPIEPRQFPSFPQAISAPPPWLLDNTNAPFDVAAYFAVPDREENAAPLYLDAIFEFSGDVHECFPDAQEYHRKKEEVAGRRGRFVEFYRQWIKDHSAAPPADFNAKDYELGFQKLMEAQQKKKCVFELGVGLSTLLPHAQAARGIVRVAATRAWSELQQANIDGPIQYASVCLRLSRDICHRGVLIVVLVSEAMDQIVFESIVREILLQSELTIDHCDRLLSLLNELETHHDAKWLHGFQGEYITAQVTLHDVQYRVGDFTPERIKEIGEAFGLSAIPRTPGELIVQLSGGNSVKQVKQIDATTAAEFERETAFVDATYKSLLDVLDRPVFERYKMASKIIDRVKNTTNANIARSLLSNVSAMFQSQLRAKTRLRAFKCLVCIRRWQLENSGAAPTELDAALKAAGINEPVVDAYGSGEPLRFTSIDGKPVVYSIGADGKDDKGLKEWTQNVKDSGDWTFRLESAKEDNDRRDRFRKDA